MNIRNINLAIFHWSEIINLGILCLFYNVIDHTFFYIYALILLSVGTLKIFAGVKNISFFSDIESGMKKNSLIMNYSVFLAEFSLIFLKYTKINVTITVVLTAVLIFAMYAYLFVIRSDKDIILLLLVLSVIALMVMIPLNVFSEKKLFFNIATELIKLSFVMGLIFLFRFRESYLIGLVILGAACILLLINRELGSGFVLLFGYDIFCLSSKEKKVRKTALIITVITVFMWLAVFLTPLYDVFYNMVTHIFSWNQDICDQIHTAMQRMFFHYSATDQLPLVHSLINGRNIITKLTCTFSPSEFTEIIKYETGSTTSSADYCYDLILFYLGPITGILLAVSSFIVYLNGTVRSFHNKYSIIPIVLFSQTFIHVFGNIMIFPFTGIPYPFLSFGNANLIINFIMVVIFSEAELKGDIE